MRRWLGRAVLIVVLLGLAGGAGFWFLRRERGEAPLYRTAQVTRGNVVATISATGTVEPEEVIDVGAQGAGQIVSFGKDASGKPIDYGSAVEEGTALAQIDDSLYASDEAQVELAQAGLERAQADLEQMKAKLYQAQRDWDRAQKLGSSEGPGPDQLRCLPVGLRDSQGQRGCG